MALSGRGALAALSRALAKAGTVVDALFGTGLTRPLKGRAQRAVEAINKAGRPVVATVLESSDTAATVLHSGAGIVVAPGDPRRLVEAIRTMKSLSTDERRRMGSAGRAWAMANVP